MEEIYEMEFDMWQELGVSCGGYASDIDRLAILVMKAHQRPIDYNRSTAEKVGCSEEFAELMQYIICSAGLWTYGTSPRGCFPEDDEKVAEFIAKCEEQYKSKWQQPTALKEG